MARLEQAPDDLTAAVQRYGPDEAAASAALRPGDFILTHEKGWQNGLIRWGQALRFRGKNRKYNRWSHAALIVSKDGDLIEAVGAGVKKSHLDDYRSVEYHLVCIAAYAEENDRAQMVRSWRTFLE